MKEASYTWYYLDGYLSKKGDNSFMCEARGRYNLYNKADVYIPDNGLVCGNLDIALENEIVTNRINRHFFNQKAYQQVINSSRYSEQEKRDLQDKIDKFKPFIFTERTEKIYNEAELLAWEANLATSNHYNGHQVVDYATLLESGVPGIIARAAIKSEQADDPEKKIFYDAIALAFQGAAEYIKRHALAAATMLTDDDLPAYDENRLKKIINICNAISEHKPAGFIEGVCLVWFFICFADYDSLGRFDQYLYPLYIKSRDQGMSRSEAKSIIEDFWRMLDKNGAIINMTIGGSNPDGSSCVNELTLLILEVTRELRLKGPNLCFRVSDNETKKDTDIWSHIHESLAAGNALPALYNENIIIPMLIREGITKYDAWDFALAGCSQIVIPGKSSFACDIGTYNALKCLDLALHNGFDKFIGKQVGPRTGEIALLNSLADVKAVLFEQFNHAIATGVSINNKDHSIRTDFLSCIRSALTNDCLDKGLSLFQGGARYYAVQNEVVGLTNLANALLVVEQIVFTEKKISLPDFVKILDDNYEGNENFRQYIINNVPKFGNGNEYVDNLRAEVTKEFFSRLSAHKAPLGGRHWPGEVIFHYNVQLGRVTGATADGRLAGEPLADSAGPSQGTDKHGLMGIFDSMQKIEYCSDAYPNTCCCLNLKFDLRFWQRAKAKIVDLLRTYMAKGFQLQINVLNAKDLQEALIHPQKYSWLVVRVGGYSAYFTALDPDIQQDIIKRTMQEAV